MEKKPIYLDYAATSPLDPSVLDRMLGYLTAEGHFGNAGSRSHWFGWQAEEAVEEARGQVATAIGADPREIFFTSGATESNNLAIKGAAQMYAPRGKHLITVSTEHKAVLDVFRYLETQGYSVTYLVPDAEGLIRVDQIAEVLRPETRLVSVMLVNNEIGVVQPIADIGRLCREKGVLLHVDAAQALGKVPLSVEALQADLLSLSAHKIYGPKGIGALYVRRKPRVRLTPQMHGGGQERGLRSGTLPVHQIVGFGQACQLAVERQPQESLRLQSLKERLWKGMQSLEAVYLNGTQQAQKSVPNILNASFAYVEGESLMMALKGIAVSSGSACTSSSLEPSYVLTALGKPAEVAHSSIRFSLGYYTTESEIDEVNKQLIESVNRLREMSPLWELYQNGVDLKTIQWKP